MKTTVHTILICLITSTFTACLHKPSHTTYDVRVINRSDYELIVDFKTIDTENVVTLTNDTHRERISKSIHPKSFMHELRGEYSDNEFKAKIKKVQISKIMPDGDTIALAQNFEHRDHWEYNQEEVDEIVLHDYYLILTNEEVE